MPTNISAKTQLCGIFLHPATHTRSPAMHNSAFSSMGVDARYLAFDVLPENLESAIQGARSLGIRQLAISIPHKETVRAFLDEVDETAAAIGAINTVTRIQDRLVGSNTDWIGVVTALEQQCSLSGKNALVLGAGGAARAAVFGLVQRGAQVTVLNRTVEKARQLVQDLGGLHAGSLEDIDQTDFSILINTTSVGLGSDESPVPSTTISEKTTVFDAVYEPEETRLLREARERGATIIHGKWWLVYQAAEQIRLWTGQEAPVEVMATAFDNA